MIGRRGLGGTYIKAGRGEMWQVPSKNNTLELLKNHPAVSTGDVYHVNYSIQHVYDHWQVERCTHAHIAPLACSENV